MIALAIIELIRDEMDARGWSRSALARALVTNVATVDYLMAGEVRQMSPALAGRLASVFGTSTTLWLNLAYCEG